MVNVIPDSIEPVVGWKSWNVTSDGMLHSPSYPLTWKPEEAATAACPLDDWEYRWVAVRSKDIPDKDLLRCKASATQPTMIARAMVTDPSEETKPPHPKTILPQGMSWTLKRQKIEHVAPAEDCSCGIYIAATPDLAFGYGEVVGQCYGWGQVAEHSQGWRVQYAYPKELFVMNSDLVEKLGEYQVPVSLGQTINMNAAVVQAVPERSRLKPLEIVSAIVMLGAIVANIVIFSLDTTVFGGLGLAAITGLAGFVGALSLRKY